VRLNRAPSVPSGFRTKGTYVITGGGGAIAAHCARHLLKKYDASVALVGRSPLTAERAAFVDELRSEGGRVSFFQADVTDREAMRDALHRIRHKLGPIRGVLHAAGRCEDGLITSKTRESVDRVLAAKVAGTMVLDDLTRDDPLEIMALFSSLSGVM